MPPRPAALAAALAALTAGGVARGDPPCAPSVEFGADVPPRVAERLRARLASLRPGGAACGALEFRWSRNRLVIEVALDDGRVARRTLSSLDDALPTVLALLATPPEASPRAEAPTSPPAPPAPAAPASAPMTVAPAAAPSSAPAPLVAPATAEPRWRLRVGGALGGGWSEGRGLFTQRVELDFALRAVVFGVYGQWGHGGDEDAGTGVREQTWGVSARWRIPLGRWRFELGGVFAFGTRGPDDARGDNDRTRPVWLFRAGADLAASFQITRGLSAFGRVEALGTLGRLAPDATADGAPFSALTSLGLRMEIGL